MTHPYAPGVVVVSERVQMPAGVRAEQRDERGLPDPGDVPDRGDPPLAQLAGRHRADAPQPLDRQRMEERQLLAGWHDQQAVRLADTAGHLGQEFRPGHAHRDGQPDPLAHVGPQADGDLGRRAADPFQATDLEERLVDGDALDDRSGVPEHGEDILAGLRVRRHPGWHHYGPRAQRSRLSQAHRRAYPERLRLVAGREHDTHADQHRPPSQAGIVALLHRRVERVQVGVQDRGSIVHGHILEHLF